MTSYHLSNRSSIVSALSELVAFKSRIVVEYPCCRCRLRFSLKRLIKRPESAALPVKTGSLCTFSVSLALYLPEEPEERERGGAGEWGSEEWGNKKWRGGGREEDQESGGVGKRTSERTSVRPTTTLHHVRWGGVGVHSYDATTNVLIVRLNVRGCSCKLIVS